MYVILYIIFIYYILYIIFIYYILYIIIYIYILLYMYIIYIYVIILYIILYNILYIFTILYIYHDKPLITVKDHFILVIWVSKNSREDVDDFRHNFVAPGLDPHVLCGER